MITVHVGSKKVVLEGPEDVEIKEPQKVTKDES